MVFLYSFLKYQYRWCVSAGRSGQAQAMINNSELSQRKKNKATIYRAMDIKCGKHV